MSRDSFIYAALVVAIAGLVIFSDKTDPDGARQTLIHAGLEPVNVGGYNLFGCGQSDFYRTKFRAFDQRGMTVEGTVCRGLFSKSSTIRYD